MLARVMHVTAIATTGEQRHSDFVGRQRPELDLCKRRKTPTNPLEEGQALDAAVASSTEG